MKSAAVRTTSAQPVAALTALVAGLIVFVSYFLTVSRFENDHFVIIARARQVLSGDWPVRDFIDPGMPLTYLMSAGAAVLGGPTFLTEAVLCIALIAVATSMTVLLVHQLTGAVWLAIAAAALTLAVPTRLYGATKVACLFLAMWLGVRAARRAGSGGIAALGVWTGVAFLVRFDYAVYIGIAAVVMMALSRDSWRQRAQTVGLYACCALIVVVPWLLYVQVVQGLGEYVGSAIRFAQSEGARTVTGVPSFVWPLWQPSNLSPALFYGFVAVPCVALLLAARMPRSSARAELAFLAILTLLCDVAFLRDAIGSRIGDVVAQTAVVAACVSALLVPRRMLTPLAVGASLALATLGAATFIRQGGSLNPVEAAQRWGQVVERLARSDAEMAPGGPLPAIAAYIGRCTPPGERVIVSGFAPEIPVLAGRPFAGGVPSWLLGYYVTPPDVRILERHLQRERVGAVVLLEGPEVFVLSWPSIARGLRASGMEEYAMTTGRPGYRIWLRADPASNRTDAATGWPCRAV